MTDDLPDARRRLGTWACDIVHDALLDLHGSTLQGKASVLTVATEAAWHDLQDEMKRKSRPVPTDEETLFNLINLNDSDGDPTFDKSACGIDYWQVLKLVRSTLRPQRANAVLAHYAGITDAELADLLKTTEANVRKQRSRDIERVARGLRRAAR